MIRKIARRIRGRILPRGGRVTFSQCGEDLIVEQALAALGRANVRYLDIGANDPVRLSNTYRLYMHGCSGACVEPIPALAAKIRRVRPRDICIEAAIAGRSSDAVRFFVFDPPELSTFVEADARKRESDGSGHIAEELEIPVLGINELLAERLDFVPDFASLDIEGLDFDVLANWDFSRFRPPVLSVETVVHSKDASGAKIGGIFDRMTDCGYTVFADTYLNTIFVDWSQRGPSK
jgi:FkbM family methyltransferase